MMFSKNNNESCNEYIKIPQFDFIGNNSSYNIASTYVNKCTACSTDQSCIGFNNQSYRYDFSNPQISSSDFYIRAVKYGKKFAVVNGWDSLGNDIAQMSVASATVCAYQCTLNTFCVGATWDGSSLCWLKSSFSNPYRKNYRNMLIPLGKAECPMALVSTGNCINANPYTKIPNFDFTGNTIANTKILYDSENFCTSNLSCLGINGNGSYFNSKSDLSDPVNTKSDFYIHNVSYSMKFSLTNNWTFSGGDIPGMPIILRSASSCAYECTLASNCVGAVWDGISQCWLKSFYNTPYQSNNGSLLMPIGYGGCTKSLLDKNTCIDSIPYNVIPNFDFPTTTNLAHGNTLDDTKRLCDSHTTCVGFNNGGYCKNDFNNGIIANGKKTYVHAVQFGMKFVVLSGFNIFGSDMEGMPMITVSASVCAYQCSIHRGCVGAIWNGVSKCWLKSFYRAPYKNASFSMLVPVGSGGCPSSVIASGKCATPIPQNDILVICDIFVYWHLYKSVALCWQYITQDYSTKITFDNQLYITSISLSDMTILSNIPSIIGNLSRLTRLDFGKAKLTGTIPSEIGRLSKLLYLDLTYNPDIYGIIPNSLCNITQINVTGTVKVLCPPECSNNCNGNVYIASTKTPTLMLTHTAMPTLSPVSTSSSAQESSSSSSLKMNAIEISGIAIGVLIILSIIAFIIYRTKFKNKSVTKDANNVIDDVNDIENGLIIDKSKRFTWNDIVLTSNNLEKIGEGSFGFVMKAKLISSSTDAEVVVKVMKTPHSLFQIYRDELKNAENEVRIHLEAEKKVRNKEYIVQVHGIVSGPLSKQLLGTFHRVQGSKAVGIVMRYEPGGNLSSVIEYNKAVNIFKTEKMLIPMATKLRILSQVVRGIAELHHVDIVHADIKPDNILLSSVDLNEAEVRLADFGLALIRYQNFGESSFIHTNNQRGTPVYMAPEQHVDAFKDNLNIMAKSSKKTDIYSFAILAWEFLSEQKPFSHMRSSVDLMMAIHQGRRPNLMQLPPDCPVAVRGMIECCWDPDRSVRLSAIECYSILNKCYGQLVHMVYDIYFTHTKDSKNETLLTYIHDRLLAKGFKMAEKDEVVKEDLVNIISKSKVILCILDQAYQTNQDCLFELQSNREMNNPRPVIPLFIETPSDVFPDNEIQAHCQMALPTTKTFDISNFIQPFYDDSYVKNADLSSLVGIDSLELEMDKLYVYINHKMERHVSAMNISKNISIDRSNDNESCSNSYIKQSNITNTTVAQSEATSIHTMSNHTHGGQR